MTPQLDLLLNMAAEIASQSYTANALSYPDYYGSAKNARILASSPWPKTAAQIKHLTAEANATEVLKSKTRAVWISRRPF